MRPLLPTISKLLGGETPRSPPGLEATDVRYEAAIAEEIVIRESLHGLATRVTETEQELAILRLAAPRDVVRESYMTAGSDGGVTRILGSTSFVDIPVRATYLSAANERDLLVIDEMLAVEAEFPRPGAGTRRGTCTPEGSGCRDRKPLRSSSSRNSMPRRHAEYRELEAAWQRQEEERRAAGRGRTAAP